MSNNQRITGTESFSSPRQNILIPVPFPIIDHELARLNLKESADQRSEFQQLEDNQISQKQSAQMKAEDISKEQFSDEFVKELKKSSEDQEKFMNSIGYLKNSIIQEQILSHITTNSGSKFQRLNYKLVNQYSLERIQKMQKNKRKKKNWSEQDLKILVWIVAKYCESKKIIDVYYGINQDDWKYISSIIPGTTDQMCMFKWLSLKKSKVRDQRWQQKEKDLLKKLVQKHGQKDWNQIAKKLFYQNPNKKLKIYRCGKQCREHWNCFLNPNIRRGNWTKQQDIKLVKMILNENVQRKWAKLASEFQGRTENALKNRYSILIEKELKQSRLPKKTPDIEILQKYLQKNVKEQPIKKQQENQMIQQKQEQTNNIKEKRQETLPKNINEQNVSYEDMVGKIMNGHTFLTGPIKKYQAHLQQIK